MVSVLFVQRLVSMNLRFSVSTDSAREQIKQPTKRGSARSRQRSSLLEIYKTGRLKFLLVNTNSNSANLNS